MPSASGKVDSVREFVFSYRSAAGESRELRTSVCLTSCQSPAELCHRLMLLHKLPCYLHQLLQSDLESFILSERIKIQDECSLQAVSKVIGTSCGKKDHVQQMINDWSSAFLREVRDYASVAPASDEMLFSEIYHSLIHSQSLETLLSLDDTYGADMHKLLDERDSNISSIEKRQQLEMEAAVSNVGSRFTDDHVNELTLRHFENLQMVESRWASELSALRTSQRREYRDCVMKLHEDSHFSANTASPAYRNALKALSMKLSSPFKSSGGHLSSCDARREESFTVHLGAQLKTTHNLRLVSANVLDFCRHLPSSTSSSSVHRRHTAVSLYSNSLSGLVLLVDDRLNSYTGIKREFARACEQSTDFHFASVEQQFEMIGDCLVNARDWRLRRKPAAASDVDLDKMSAVSSASSTSDDREETLRSRAVARLTVGDVYLTRHSNLSDVHVVFHIVSDDSVSGTSCELTSRHPIIASCRNILRICFRYDIRHITLPLLLVHEMTEELTMQWCLKRAELVFKCIKGFVMELALWTGQEAFTIQFLVPKGLSDEAFMSISSMLPTIFRMSNPVVAKS